jgi:UDP-N-acetylmuramoylalanine--D-glutamate ligase
MEKNRTVLIMGLGLHGGGTAAANYFSSRGMRVTITDLKTGKELEDSIQKIQNKRNVRFVLGRHRFEDFRSVDLIIKNPGVPPDSPYLRHAREHGVKIDTDVGIFLDHITPLTSNTVGVTGTKGKSTTAALLFNTIKQKYSDALLGGNITVSVFDLLDKIHRGTYVVLELSSFQLGGIRERRYSPRIGIFTNFMEDHQNYYPDMDAYWEDKSVLYKFQKEGDTLVINRDDPILRRIVSPGGVRRVSFGMKDGFEGNGSFIDNGRMVYREGKKTVPISDTGSLKIPGNHNLYNALAAAATLLSEGFSVREIQKGLSTFRGLEHRLEYITSINDITFYNDSAATTPDAAIQGIESLGGRLTVITGGSDKGLNLENFIDVLNRKVENLVLLKGEGTDRLLQTGVRKKYQMFNNLEEAVRYAYGK